MNANTENSVEGFEFSLRELRHIATQHLPDTVDDFFCLLELWARNETRKAEASRQTILRRQAEIERKSESQADE